MKKLMILLVPVLLFNCQLWAKAEEYTEKQIIEALQVLEKTPYHIRNHNEGKLETALKRVEKTISSKKTEFSLHVSETISENTYFLFLHLNNKRKLAKKMVSIFYEISELRDFTASRPMAEQGYVLLHLVDKHPEYTEKIFKTIDNLFDTNPNSIKFSKEGLVPLVVFAILNPQYAKKSMNLIMKALHLGTSTYLQLHYNLDPSEPSKMVSEKNVKALLEFAKVYPQYTPRNLVPIIRSISTPSDILSSQFVSIRKVNNKYNKQIEEYLKKIKRIVSPKKSSVSFVEKVKTLKTTTMMGIQKMKAKAIPKYKKK